MIASAKRRICADEYYPESYADMGYVGLDGAVDALQRLIDATAELDGFVTDIQHQANQLDRIEWFSSPDDAYGFNHEINKIASDLSRLYDKAYDAFDKFTNF